MIRWYAVQTHARGEVPARVQLERQGFRAYLPLYNKRVRHARKTTWRAAPLFPRYLFVAIDIDNERWRAVQSTRGVQRLICNGETPAAIPDGVIEGVMAREDETGAIRMEPTPPFAPGEAVRITGGALCDRVGLFDCAADEDRVFILLDLLGRNVRVRVPLDALNACA